jgi:CRP/FNR family transcriptional regulator, cyclic AMP receptor protein
MQWPLLDGLPEEDVRRVISIARRRTFARNEVVFHEHDPADTLHLVRKGRFAASVSTRLGDAAILSVMGPGEMFGELALLGPDERRSATVASLEAGETLSVHRLDFERLRGERPEVGDVLIAILSAQVRRLSRHLLDALYVAADQRVLRRLAEVSEVYAVDDEGDGEATDEVVVPLTQEHLADMAGTSRATVNRVLREQEERGVVELRRGRTIVRDRDALRARAG